MPSFTSINATEPPAGQRRIDLLRENLLDLWGKATIRRIQRPQGCQHLQLATDQSKYIINGCAIEIRGALRRDVKIDPIEGLDDIRRGFRFLRRYESQGEICPEG